MIILKKKNWLHMLFAVRGSSLKETWPRILVVTLFAIVVTFVETSLQVEVSLTATPFTLVGLALAIFLGFRNNESYDRFWEGRKLWGALVNVSRSFARQAHTLIQSDQESETGGVDQLHEALILRTIAYVHAFRHHLRDTDPLEELQQYLEPAEIEALRTQQNVPIYILQRTGTIVRDAWERGWIHDLHVTSLDASLTEFTSIQGGCERIKSTPLPFTYNVLIHRIVALYCLALPFGLVAEIGVLTPVVVAFISYAFFGLDAIGEEVEQPFGTDENHLALHALSRMIEINLLQLNNVDPAQLPPNVEPVDGVLN